MSAVEQIKPVHTILLDASPILLNTPSISTLTAQSQVLVTTPAVIAEIKGEEARSRFNTLYRPFISIRQPKPESIKHVKDFARRTGDLAVLSGTDIEVLALAYDLEVERNGGDWRLRNVPGQKRVNGKKPEPKVEENEETPDGTVSDEHTIEITEGDKSEDSLTNAAITEEQPQTRTVWGITHTIESLRLGHDSSSPVSTEHNIGESEQVTSGPVQSPSVSDNTPVPAHEITPSEAIDEEPDLESDSSDSGGEWITPSNLKKQQIKDSSDNTTTRDTTQKVLQAATMTGDFAMQNVLLQMNLNLLSTSTCKRVSSIKQTILRCHACFATTKEMTRQFCSRCGKPTLTRVTCTTNEKGEVKLHLKQNFQWNNRGNVYSIPKPTAGTANGKYTGPKSGGGRNGWGNGLVLAEDQKEYVRAMVGSKRQEKKELMDEDALPGFMTGDRQRGGGGVKVGAGRNVNSRKR